MPFTLSRIPAPGGHKTMKKPWPTPPSASLRAHTSGMTLPRTSIMKSPAQFQRSVKRLQFSGSQETNIQEQRETQAGLRTNVQVQTPLKLPRSLQQSAAASTAVSNFVPSTDPATQSDNIRVLLRIRPSPGKDTKKCLEVAPDQRGVTLAPMSQQEKRFGFDRVFTESCEQDDIFQDAGRRAVENTIEGYNGSIFAYGQTGSGKTFTMLGGATTNAHELRELPSRGLTPRIIDYLFQQLTGLARERNLAFYNGEEQERALQYTLACSYLEIYNEKIFDLLEPGGSVAAQQPKNLREDHNKAVYVDQLREIDVGSEEEALTLLQLGSQNRHVSSTEMNRESSRSHAVFSVKLVLEERTSAGVKRIRRSCLHLVDLAGSEKQRQTHVHGKRLKEAAQINKSLSALGNVIMALVEVSNGQKRHVHYRDSKLTFLLRDALGGNAITSIVATISPEEKYFAETLSTLKFAQRAKFIKNNAVQNEDADSLVPVLKQQIEKLVQEIASLRSSVGIGLTSSASVTDSDISKDEQIMRLKLVADAEAEARAQEKKKSQSRWEPAMDMMQKLLRASGAMSSADNVEEEEPRQQQLDVVKIRCDRLEMLLYRMICRFEEYKEVTFDPYRSAAVRYHHVDNQEHSADDDGPAAVLVAAEKRERELHKKVHDQHGHIEELLRRSQEAETENDLIRHELCELLEWKAFVEEERRRVSDAVLMDPQLESEDDEQETPILAVSTVPSEEIQDMQEMLNAYRSVMRMIMGDDCISVDGFEASEDGDGGASDTYREIRRVNALSSRLGRKLDLYQDTIQRLEKELQTTKDELETSSAATKFAEFQLQQLRTLAADEEAKQSQAEHKLRKKLNDLEETLRSQRNKMARLLDEKLAEDVRTLRCEQEVARREVEHLKHCLCNSSGSGDNGNDRERMESVLLATQKRIEDLEQEIKASRSTLATLEMLKASDDEKPVQLETLLDCALGDNAKLLETMRDLHHKRQRSSANLQLLSLLFATTADANLDSETSSEESKTMS
ncbi:unnamed protein product [Peronospora destructor]|uniref:Kinesin motor domain-containing protein n=1 Tax=Peronospora destructor TaxID=86335 RepID=A0AAV0VGB5_9STRA|nr:unnamed protein product [Peronospora destructor]